MNQVFTSWSGGKDSCLACYLAATSGLEVSYLANMLTEDGKRSWTHGQTTELLQTQAEAIGIPLIQQRTTTAGYETEFKNMVLALKQKGISGGVFGDIDMEEHRQWVERVCQEVAITPHLPLWGQSQDKIMSNFIDLGFEAIVVAAKANLFGEEILGRKVDLDFIKYLKELGKTEDVTLCGEAGEYHTLVIDGPLFQRRLEIVETRKVLREGTRFLEILNAKLDDK